MYIRYAIYRGEQCFCVAAAQAKLTIQRALPLYCSALFYLSPVIYHIPTVAHSAIVFARHSISSPFLPCKEKGLRVALAVIPSCHWFIPSVYVLHSSLYKRMCYFMPFSVLLT